MRWNSVVGVVALLASSSVPAAAQNNLIVRVLGGAPVLQTACGLVGCSVVRNLDGSFGSLFLVAPPAGVDPNAFLLTISGQFGVLDAEVDVKVNTLESSTPAPAALTDRTPVDYYGTTVPHGYISQPATQMIRVADAQGSGNNSGAGIVAVIDTGVDPNHPALQSVLLSGYDFTRDYAGPADETADLPLVNPPSPGDPQPTNPQSSALVDQSTAAVIDGNPQFSAFGHGTMVAGLVHLVAPTALILPLKAFAADGTANNSDIIRAVYYAIQHNANVLNMSFHLPGTSQELRNALTLAYALGVVPVAAAGNEGSTTQLYPAAFSTVICVASVANDGTRSTFTNYGSQYVWVAAPGEGVVTTYPYATYAAGWGTSFSTPLVSGTIALLHSSRSIYGKDQSANAVSHATAAAPELGHGVLNVLSALQAADSPMDAVTFHRP